MIALLVVYTLSFMIVVLYFSIRIRDPRWKDDVIGRTRLSDTFNVIFLASIPILNSIFVVLALLDLSDWIFRWIRVARYLQKRKNRLL